MYLYATRFVTLKVSPTVGLRWPERLVLTTIVILTLSHDYSNITLTLHVNLVNNDMLYL